MNIQKKALAEMARLAQERNLELVVNESYANTGQVLFMSGFETHVEIRYDFQTTDVTFRIYGPNDKSRLNDGRKHYVTYSKAQDWKMFWDYLVTQLPWKTKPKAVTA